MNTKKMLQSRAVYVFLLSLLTALGCGGNPKVTGRVAFEDGTPLTVGTVCFESDKLEARGEIDKSGNYVMGTLAVSDGVPAGNYRVSVTGAVETTGKMMDTGGRPESTARPEYRSLIDQKFGLPSTSGLTCEVKGATKFDIVVSKPK